MKGKLLTVLFLGVALLPLSACGSSDTAPTTPAESPSVSPSAGGAMSPSVSPAPGGAMSPSVSPVPSKSPATP
jgi:hypothetical protein